MGCVERSVCQSMRENGFLDGRGVRRRTRTRLRDLWETNSIQTFIYFSNLPDDVLCVETHLSLLHFSGKLTFQATSGRCLCAHIWCSYPLR